MRTLTTWRVLPKRGELKHNGIMRLVSVGSVDGSVPSATPCSACSTISQTGSHEIAEIERIGPLYRISNETIPTSCCPTYSQQVICICPNALEHWAFLKSATEYWWSCITTDTRKYKCWRQWRNAIMKMPVSLNVYRSFSQQYTHQACNTIFSRNDPIVMLILDLDRRQQFFLNAWRSLKSRPLGESCEWPCNICHCHWVTAAAFLRSCHLGGLKQQGEKPLNNSHPYSVVCGWQRRGSAWCCWPLNVCLKCLSKGVWV